MHSQQTEKLVLPAGVVERAFRLAFFIHPDREIALRITAEALFFLEKQISGRSRRSDSKPRGYRTKVRRNRSQLLQDLICAVALSAEYRPSGRSLTSDECLIRFLVHLIRITTRRNSFYVNLGISRILYSYSTADAVAIQDVLTQDPERLRPEAYFRYSKGLLLSEIRNLFGSGLKTVRGERGEVRLCSSRGSRRHVALVEETLHRLIPWQTRCILPRDLDPRLEEIPALGFHGEDPDDEHPIELSRMHAVLCSRCFRSLLRNLGLAPPDEHLRIPHFFISENAESSMHEISEEVPLLERSPDPLGERGHLRIAAELESIRLQQRRWSLSALGAMDH